jgi:hypothetical protein
MSMRNFTTGLNAFDRNTKNIIFYYWGMGSSQ